MEQNKSQPQPNHGTENEPLTLRAGTTIKQRRIDKYLHGRFSNFSRVMIQKQINSGCVKVNGKVIKCSFKLSPGDTIEMTLPQSPSKEIMPEDMPLRIIYEDDDIIVLNKQSSILVHPARGNTHGTLVNALAFYSDKLSSGLGEFRPGIGTPELTADRINAPLGIHPKFREKYAIRPEIGKEAITFYKVLESFRGFSLLELTPKTGRTHQIRVHLSYIKHSIVADDMYGGKLIYPWQLADEEPAVQEPIIGRVALHAHALEFKHPTTKKQVKFEALLPQDMQNLLDMLRQYRKL
ncbi:MAG: pseudouridine synthase [Planctomycetota bacterium]|jgi:23S rRNA pseudouridine1911/1915/1917 synthase